MQNNVDWPSVWAVSPEQLLETARSLVQRAYAPYSRFPVGAALLTEKMEVFGGCNIENGSYGLTICAERVAIGNWRCRSDAPILAIAIVAADIGPCYPCGACRQVLQEFAPDVKVLLEDWENGKKPLLLPMQDLYPYPFRP
ncbi:MAG: cytidine deaminase [Synergistales bacterium]|nr:cytidine deaminase [Synergistales bacterium]